VNRTAPPNVNDGSNDPPKLRVYANGWGLLELPRLPREKSWTADERLDRIADAGFAGLQADAKYLDGLKRRGLRFCTSARVSVLNDVDPAIRKASESGAECITLHVGWGMESDAETDALVDAVLASAHGHRIPAYIETHRATITQDLWRTCELARRIPEVRFNADLSHYYCGCEMGYQGFDTTIGYLEPILARTGFFHGRISDGQCMQVDVGDGRENVHARNFVRAWRRGMELWLRGARRGDVLIFAPELGPPSSGYSITTRDPAGQVIELSDRWKQSLVLKRLAEEAFALAVASSTAAD
jgi:sugar phosphate isomerase/epimerase